ncbi:MAG: MarR family transcriptional regulator [Clostridiales bacterium]|nr:MarR family transcriptional regulator [Clostridiales bacterium]
MHKGEAEIKESLYLKEFDTMFSRMLSLNMYIEKSFVGEQQLSEIRCIEAIWKANEINIKGLSASCRMTKGAVSKIAQKLIKKGLVECFCKPDNRKEVWLKLTGKGLEAALRHQGYHDMLENRDKVVFNSLNDSEKDAVIKFFQTFNNHLDEKLAEYETPGEE